MIKYKAGSTEQEEAKLADKARSDRYEKSAAASKRCFDSDGQVRRDDETAENNRLI